MQDYNHGPFGEQRSVIAYGDQREKETEGERGWKGGRGADRSATRFTGARTHTSTLDTRNDSISHRSACSPSQWSTARADICFRALSATFCWRVVWIFARTDIGTNISEHRARRWIWYDKPMCGMAGPSPLVCANTHVRPHICLSRFRPFLSASPDHAAIHTEADAVHPSSSFASFASSCALSLFSR